MPTEYYQNRLSGEIKKVTCANDRPNMRFWKKISEERYVQLLILYNTKPQERVG